MEYKITKMAGLRWRVTILGGGSFNTSSLAEALEFVRQHGEAQAQLRDELSATLLRPLKT